jgi:hypothetical protein
MLVHAQSAGSRSLHPAVQVQVTGSWQVRKAHLRGLCNRAQALCDSFPAWPCLEHVRREQNLGADSLVNRTLDAAVQQRGQGRGRGSAGWGSRSARGYRDQDSKCYF